MFTDLFSKRPQGMKRPSKTFYSYKNKKQKFEQNGKKKYGEMKFKDRKFKKHGGDKTNSHKRDLRPIGVSRVNNKRKK